MLDFSPLLDVNRTLGAILASCKLFQVRLGDVSRPSGPATPLLLQKLHSEVTETCPCLVCPALTRSFAASLSGVQLLKHLKTCLERAPRQGHTLGKALLLAALMLSSCAVAREI